MKVAISIPEKLFEEAEQLVGRMGTSRSQLYAKALAEFVARHDDDQITAAMDQVVKEAGIDVDEFSRRAARRAFKKSPW